MKIPVSIPKEDFNDAPHDPEAFPIIIFDDGPPYISGFWREIKNGIEWFRYERNEKIPAVDYPVFSTANGEVKDLGILSKPPFVNRKIVDL